MNCYVQFLDDYVKEAERRFLWSSSRFNALVELAADQDDARLVDCIEPCMGARLHVLYVYLPRAKESKFLAGTVQIE